MDGLTTKRLALIKQLYNIGIEQSYMPEPTNGFCLLPFHDSAEMFMKLCADFKGETIARDNKFMEYYKKLPNLKCKAQMQNLNNKRVALKHYGSLPSVLDIEISRVNISDFLRINTLIFFDIDFSNISLTWLIKYPNVQKLAKKSELLFKEKKYHQSLYYSHCAFLELLYCYEYTKPYEFRQLLRICKPDELSVYKNDFSTENKYNSNLKKQFELFNNSFKNIDNVLKIIGLGIDYKKYMKFKLIVPDVYRTPNDNYKEIAKNTNVKENENSSLFCFDFVIECALKIQKIDFDVNVDSF